MEATFNEASADCSHYVCHFTGGFLTHTHRHKNCIANINLILIFWLKKERKLQEHKYYLNKSRDNLTWQVPVADADQRLKFWFHYHFSASQSHPVSPVQRTTHLNTICYASLWLCPAKSIHYQKSYRKIFHSNKHWYHYQCNAENPITGRQREKSSV